MSKSNVASPAQGSMSVERLLNKCNLQTLVNFWANTAWETVAKTVWSKKTCKTTIKSTSKKCMPTKAYQYTVTILPHKSTEWHHAQTIYELHNLLNNHSIAICSVLYYHNIWMLLLGLLRIQWWNWTYGICCRLHSCSLQSTLSYCLLPMQYVQLRLVHGPHKQSVCQPSDDASPQCWSQVHLKE